MIFLVIYDFSLTICFFRIFLWLFVILCG